ncbi:MAG: cytochrome c family protein [Pseudodesulfovibrio sp.]|uniref:Cytochrome c, class III, conserved region n=1 Tax=Pseudodesulfovibrio aespoeensis (strain ATCC 700646 / DSM 10631 / Aspo-2) TaxID=643562 RepID=E6VW77_PSEA9|nr:MULTISPECIES: cytochrome c3 family protein [Pseudodesulfovibrio]MBU4378659.1 cytochrome c family protein [Pseudomonadota bacterium]MCG2740743.1 cytochrome c family protein [Syntrophaceae bacterium]ADU63637.1 Cytochrome c, class III, conserved region [Pseudodesulfovibrio aespoeensis Aspo-2]MBU4475524.1 cytochrome c family protein [Pseudomonadota bacterium]MBU4515380.1 cytochrome c family protein [Pseudomonadota bacterium]
MHKKHLRHSLAFIAAVAALVVVYLAPMAFSQDDMTVVPAEAFGVLKRPQVAFEHDAHNEKAQLEDCVVCHHGRTDDGLMDMENSSEGETCESCHPVNPVNNETPLMRAYHRQCITCHTDQAKGPVACGECHRK